MEGLSQKTMQTAACLYSNKYDFRLPVENFSHVSRAMSHRKCHTNFQIQRPALIFANIVGREGFLKYFFCYITLHFAGRLFQKCACDRLWQVLFPFCTCYIIHAQLPRSLACVSPDIFPCSSTGLWHCQNITLAVWYNVTGSSFTV